MRCFALLYALCGLCLVALVANLAHAQSATTEDDFIIDLSVDDFQGDQSLQDILGVAITIASRTAEPVAQASSTVTVFTRDEILGHGFTTLEELLNHIPGFQATRDIERGSAMRISARGRGSALGEYILILVDGQRVNDLYTGGPSLINRHINIEHVQQVEIIRGPGSALYGSNAFLGVINIVTTAKTKDVALRAGSIGSRKAAVNVFYRSDNGASQDASTTEMSPVPQDALTVSAFAGIFSDDGQQYNIPADRYGIGGETRDPRAGMDIYGTVSYMGLSLRARHMERRFNDFIPAGNLQRFFGEEDVRQSSLRAEVQRQITPWLNINATAHYSIDRWVMMLTIPPGSQVVPGMPNGSYILAGPIIESATRGAQAGAEIRLGSNNRLQFGISYDEQLLEEYQNISNNDPITNLPTSEDGLPVPSTALRYNGPTQRRIFGTYLQDRHSFGDRLDVTAGVRLDVYDDFGQSINPRLAMIYQTPIDSIAKLIYGRAFRAPNFLELYDQTPVTFGDPDLDAETVDTVEVAYSQKLSIANLTATYFYNSISNQIQLGPPGDDPENIFAAPAHENSVDRVSSQGVEVEVAAYPLPGLRLRGSYTRLFDNPNDGVMPGNLASLMASYRWRRLHVAIDAIARGQTPALPDQDAYILLGGHSALAVHERIRLTASVRNALDTSYQTITILLPDGIENRGRVINVGMDVDF